MTRFSQSAAQRAEQPDESQRLASWYTPGLSDALGDRLLMFDNSTSSSLELLRFRPELGKAFGFEETLRRRVDDLARLMHPSIARVRAVESLGEDDGLALISNHTVGRRLSEILPDAHGPQFATELVTQLMPALAALQEQQVGLAHGLLTAERVIVTPDGRLILTEHVLASAVDALKWPAARLGDELGLLLEDGVSRLDDPRIDVMQIGCLALSLLVGRRVASLASAREIVGRLGRASLGPGRDAPPYLQTWLGRALRVNGTPFDSASEAESALGEWPERQLSTDEPAPREIPAPKRAPAAATTPVIVATPASRPIVVEPAAQPEPAFQPEPRSDRQEFRPEPRPAFRPESRPELKPEFKPELREDQRPEPAPGWHEPTPEATPEPKRDFPRSIDRAPRAEPLLLRNQPEPDFLPESSAVTDAGHAASPRLSLLRWAVAGLSFVCLVEGMIIAGLLASRTAPPVSVAQTAAEPPPATPAPTIAAPAVAAPARTAAPAQGRLEITSEPSGARVTIDGKPAGTTPLTASVPPGEHVVVITAGENSTRRTVNVTAGSTATLMAAMAPAAPAGATGGWLTVNSPMELQVFEGTTLIGTTRAARLMLPSGRHTLRLASASLAFETTITVEIQAGRTVTTSVAAPNGTLSLNALPWANVSLDGQSLGTTPFANLSVPVGTHEVIWRHPQLGERRQTIVVTAKTPVRLVVDLRK
jgi:hypothetical protein